MKIFVFGANWYNHGDESAIRAMIDQLLIKYPNAEIKIQFNQDDVKMPYSNLCVVKGFKRPSRKRDPLNYILYIYAILNNWKRYMFVGDMKKRVDEFYDAAKWCDYAIYAPGGPSFGDYYRQYELVEMMMILKACSKPYFFFAPSMGPFKHYKNRIKYVLESADYICIREPLSLRYIRQIGVNNKVTITLDSAFQHMYNYNENYKKLNKKEKLEKFISEGKVIGITITDLQWHEKKPNLDLERKINNAFDKFINWLINENYKILFIPQLFGKDNDSSYMKKFMKKNCEIISENEDCYFQQFIISKLYAVVGMRYHSNIFSAKVGTPFISVAYEQKMSGFMEKTGLGDYCIRIEGLSYQNLKEHFELLEKDYNRYKDFLMQEKNEFVKESRNTMLKLCERINIYGLK